MDTRDKVWAAITTVGLVAGSVMVGTWIGENNTHRKLSAEQTVKNTALYDAKLNSACPTLLSIARTSRDTILVMRSESACVDRVLSTVK